MPTFKSHNEKTGEYDYLSVSLEKGEKDKLIEALNDTLHPYGAMTQFCRAAINLKLREMEIDFELSE